MYRNAGFVECKVIKVEADGKDVLLVNRGALCGCVYSLDVNKTTGRNTFLGRMRPDMTIDGDAPQAGLGDLEPLMNCSGGKQGSKCPRWAEEGDEEGWQEESVLMQKVRFLGSRRASTSRTALCAG